MTRFLFLILALCFCSCNKNDEVKSDATAPDFITKTIDKAGGTITLKDGTSIIFPANALEKSTEVSFGYTGKEVFTVKNENVKPIGKALTLRMNVDTLLKDVILQMPKPLGYTSRDKSAVVVSINPKLPLIFEEVGDKIVAYFDKTVVEIGNAIKALNPTNLPDYIIQFVVDVHLPANEELGMKEVQIDNAGNLIFKDFSKAEKTDKVLLMVHGWKGKPSGWETFLGKISPLIKNLGYTKFVTFGYYSGVGISENGAQLANQLSNKLDGATLDIVGHSMGGLVSRSAIEMHGAANRIRSLITLATPHMGAPVANFRVLAGWAMEEKGGYFNDALNVNSKGILDMAENSTFLITLNTRTRPTTQYFPIAATIDFQYPFRIEKLDADPIVERKSAFGIANNPNGSNGWAYNVKFPMVDNSLYSRSVMLILAAIAVHGGITDYDEVIAVVANILTSVNKSGSTDGLLAYYPLNGNANDESGKGNHGIIQNSPTFEAGINGQAIKLTARCDFGWCEGSSGDHVLIPMLPFNNLNSFSINIWVKERSLAWPDGESYISYGSDQGNIISIGHYHNSIRFSSSARSLLEIPFEASNLNSYQMYTLVYDKGTLKGYQNGKLAGTLANAEKGVGGDVSAIARHWGVSSYTRFTGSVDQVRIYERALSDADISGLFVNKE